MYGTIDKVHIIVYYIVRPTLTYTRRSKNMSYSNNVCITKHNTKLELRESRHIKGLIVESLICNVTGNVSAGLLEPTVA